MLRLGEVIMPQHSDKAKLALKRPGWVEPGRQTASGFDSTGAYSLLMEAMCGLMLSG